MKQESERRKRKPLRPDVKLSREQREANLEALSPTPRPCEDDNADE